MIVFGKKFNNSVEFLDIAKLALFSLVISVSIFHLIHFPSNSMDHCKQFISEDPIIAGENFYWNPNGCTMYNYSIDEIQKCFSMKKEGMVNFALLGDSTVRYIFRYFQFLIEGEFIKKKPHHCLNRTYPDLNFHIDFLWGPQVETGNQTLEGWENQDVDIENKPTVYEALEMYLNASEGVDPELLVITNGVRSLYSKPNLTLALEEYRIGLRKLKPILEKLERRGRTKILWMKSTMVNETTQRLRGREKGRINNAGLKLHNEAVEEEFADLFQLTPGILFWSVPDFFVRNEILHHEDGLHFAWPHTIRNVNLMLLNLYCNEKMDLSGDYCCRQSSSLSMFEFILAFWIISLGLLVFWPLLLRRLQKPKLSLEEIEKDEMKSGQTSFHHFAKLGSILGYVYVCKNIFPTEIRNFDGTEIWVASAAILIFGIFFQSDAQETHFLNKDQSNEIQGLMIVLILISNLAGGGISHVLVRVLESSFLFLYAYQHLKVVIRQNKEDQCNISLKNLISANMLILLMCVTLNLNYFEFRLVPMLTFWYIIQVIIIHTPLPSVFVTTHPDKWSKNWLKWKLGFSLTISFLFYIYKTRNVDFHLLGNWNQIKPLEHLWEQDCFSSLLGLIFCLLVSTFNSSSKSFQATMSSTNFKLLSTLGILVVIANYFIFVKNYQNVDDYNRIHSYSAFIPIVSYILIRNLLLCCQLKSSHFLAWFGKMSLELYSLHFYVWKAKHIQALVVLIPDYRHINFSLTSLILVLASHELINMFTF